MVTMSEYLNPSEVDNLIEPVCQIADMETSRESGCWLDPVMDELILAARKVRDREGFLVVDGDDADFMLPTDQLPAAE